MRTLAEVPQPGAVLDVWAHPDPPNTDLKGILMTGRLMTERSAPVTVTRAGSDGDWRAAASLLDDYRRWLTHAVDFDPIQAQPTAGTEFDDLSHFYRPPRGALVLAWTEGRPTGLVGVHRLRGPVGELKRMYVAPSARGLGVGRALVAEALAAATDLGLDELRLQTKPEVMAAADRLYRKFGFVDIASYADIGVPGVATLAVDPRAASRVSRTSRGAAGRSDG